MTHSAQEIAEPGTCRDANGSAEESARRPPPSAGLFQRQLAAAELQEVAKKIAAGRAIELDDAVVLSRASLALLGRIVQSAPHVIEARRASEADGFPLACASSFDLETDSEVCPTEATTGLPRQIAQPLTDWDAFCRALLETRRDIATSGDAAVWYPQVSEPPDMRGVCDGEFTGVDVLRAIALARLVLPANVRIAAPLSTLGPKLAQVAREFGASCFGFIDAEGRMSDSPQAADREVLDELQGSCSPTPLKEET